MWVTGRLWRVLAVHAAGLCCPDGVLELLVDDTLAHKSGRKVAGAGVLRDAVRSTKNRVVYAWGLNVVVVCLRVTPPWGGTPIALPINLRIHTKGNKTTLGLTEEAGTGRSRTTGCRATGPSSTGPGCRAGCGFVTATRSCSAGR